MHSNPSIIYFGTPEFSAHVLRYLIDQKIDIRAIVTQPDRPKGRSLQMTFSPVKTVAQAEIPQTPIFQPERCSEPDFLASLAALQADLYVVVAFGQILPVKLLQIPPLGCINVHASLLPIYRGAAPIQRCLMNGDRQTGISIQKMVKELDAGDVIVEAKLPISPEMIFSELERALCDLSKTTLLDVLHLYRAGIPHAIPQDHAAATYAAKIKPEEGQLHWDLPAETLHNLIRAFSPRPGAWCWVEWNGERKRLKVLKAQISSQTGVAGTLLSAKELIIACGEQALQIVEVQLEGKPKMAAVDWLRGAKTAPLFS